MSKGNFRSLHVMSNVEEFCVSRYFLKYWWFLEVNIAGYNIDYVGVTGKDQRPFRHHWICLVIYVFVLKITINNHWLVVRNMFYFPINIGLLIIPIDFHIFQRGGPTTNQITISSHFGCLFNSWWSLVTWFCAQQAGHWTHKIVWGLGLRYVIQFIAICENWIITYHWPLCRHIHLHLQYFEAPVGYPLLPSKWVARGREIRRNRAAVPACCRGGLGGKLMEKPWRNHLWKRENPWISPTKSVAESMWIINISPLCFWIAILGGN